MHYQASETVGSVGAFEQWVREDEISERLREPRDIANLHRPG